MIKNILIDKINIKEIINLLEKIINIDSPTGYTIEIEEFLMNFAKENNINAVRLNKGSIIFKFGCEKENINKNGVCFAAHIDTLGLMIKSISNDSIKINPVGGIPPIYAIGDYVTIKASDGKKYYGTVLPENPAAHVNKKIYDIIPNYDDSYIRLDHKFEENDKLESHIQVGDYVFLNPKFQYIDGYIKTRFLDDKASCALFLHIAMILSKLQKENSINFTNPVYLYFNVTEETGQGISALPDIDRLYIVDMGVVGSQVNGDEFSVSICIKDSSGPYNHSLTKDLEQVAKENNIKYKKDIFPYYGSDGSAALRSGADIKVALFGVGVSASHGYERTHEEGLSNTAKLLAALIERVI